MEDNNERAVIDRMSWNINGYDHFTFSTRIVMWTLHLNQSS